MQKVVIFGGSGFIGSHLLKELVGTGAEDIVVADLVPPRKELPGVRYFPCDVRNAIDPAMLSGPATVINLAAVHRTPGHEDHEYFDTNVAGARNVVEFCERTGSTELWFTSSISVYGPSETALSEKSDLNPNSAYGKSKREAELVHLEWAQREQGRKLLIVRPAVIFGAGEKANFTRLAAALRRGFFIFPGRDDTVKGCGYVEDLVGSLFFMSQQPESVLLYNYCYPKAYTIREICKAFCDIAGFAPPRGTIPLSLMLKAARFFRIIDSLGLRNGIHPERMYKLTRSTHVYPGELIARGYPYRTDLLEGIRRWIEDEPSGQFV